MKKSVLLLAAIVALIAAAFFGGYRLGARASTSPAYKVDIRHRVTVPHPAASAAYTLREGDLVTVAAVKLWCSVERQNVQPDSNGGPTEPILYCNRTAPPDHHYVVFLRNRLQVWKAGNNLQPVFGNP